MDGIEGLTRRLSDWGLYKPLIELASRPNMGPAIGAQPLHWISTRLLQLIIIFIADSSGYNFLYIEIVLFCQKIFS